MTMRLQFLAALLLLAAPVLGESLTDRERNRALSELHATRKLFLDAISSLNAEQWSWKPSPDQWSIAEISEHVVLTEDHYWEQIQKHVGSAGEPATKREAPLEDEEVIRRMADRHGKRKTGKTAMPTGRWDSPSTVAEEFKRRRDRLIEYVRTSDDDPRAHVWPHGALGPLDGFQWVLLACGHVHRHLQQLDEVKSAGGYPAP